MFLWPLFDYVAKNKWAQYALAGIAILGTLGFWLLLHDNKVKRQTLDKQMKRNAEERARVTETRRQIEETRSHDIITAEKAGRDLPRFDSVEQLREQRPDLYRELFGDRGEGSGQAEGR